MPSIGTKSLRGSERSNLLEAEPPYEVYRRARRFSGRTVLLAGTLAVAICFVVLLGCRHLAVSRVDQTTLIPAKIDVHHIHNCSHPDLTERAGGGFKDAIAKGEAYIKAMNDPISRVPQSIYTDLRQAINWGWTQEVNSVIRATDTTLKQAIWWLRGEHDKNAEHDHLDLNVAVWKHKYSAITSGKSGEPKYAGYTDGEFWAACDPKYIAAIWSESPKSRLVILPEGTPLPELQYWSDVMFLECQRRYPTQLKDLESVIQTGIINMKSRDIINDIFAKRPKPTELPGAIFDHDQNFEEFKALLAIPNGYGTANLLSQHKAQLGNKCVWRAHVWFPVNDFGAPSIIYRIKDSPCGPGNMKRAPSTLKEAATQGEAYIRAMDAPISAVQQSTLVTPDLITKWGWTANTNKVAQNNREQLDAPFQDTREFLRKQKDKNWRGDNIAIRNIAFDHTQAVTRVGADGKERVYPDTMGQFDAAIDPQFIGVRFAQSPSMADRNLKSSQLPELQHWSDMAFLSYQAVVGPRGLSQLAGVTRAYITEDRSIAVLDQIFAKIPKVKKFPGTVFDLANNPEGFKALLAIPNGSGVVNLLTQHKAQLGQKCIWRALVWWSSDWENTPNILYLIKDGACGTAGRKRGLPGVAEEIRKKGRYFVNTMHAPVDDQNVPQLQPDNIKKLHDWGWRSDSSSNDAQQAPEVPINQAFAQAIDSLEKSLPGPPHAEAVHVIWKYHHNGAPTDHQLQQHLQRFQSRHYKTFKQPPPSINMQFTLLALSFFGATAFAAPQVDFGCTLSCGVWNGCRARAVIDGEPLTNCGPEPNRCNCQQFADFKREAEPAPAVIEREAAPEPQVDFGCTLSCGVWNGCRARAVIDGEPLTGCGPEPDRCNCQQFADFKEKREAAPAPAPAPEPQVDFGCTLSCGVWNGCRARAVIDGEPLTGCGPEPDRCNCQQFADFKA